MRRFDTNAEAARALLEEARRAQEADDPMLLVIDRRGEPGFAVSSVEFNGDRIIPAVSHLLAMIKDTDVPFEVVAHLREAVHATKVAAVAVRNHQRRTRKDGE